MLQWAQPINLTELRSFLELTNYYREFISVYSVMARPLIDRTRLGVPVVWGTRQEAAFEQLRVALVTSPVLCFPRAEESTCWIWTPVTVLLAMC
jgi:hypothetical protein